MKVYRVIQTHHHPHTAFLSALHNPPRAFPDLSSLHGCDTTKRGFGIGRNIGAGESPEIMDATDSADEVAVGHVGESGEVGIKASRGRDFTSSAYPLSGFLCVRMGRVL